MRLLPRIVLLLPLVAACHGPDEADEEADPTCPDVLFDDLRACVDDWLADPDNAEAEPDLVRACADAEPMADAYDAWCAAEGAEDDLCAVDYEAAWRTLRPVCIEAY